MNVIQQLLMLGLLVGFGCGESGDSASNSSSTTKVTTRLRSTGGNALSLHNTLHVTRQTAGFLAHSSVQVESFKVPIGRINLTAGDTGSGYTEASPNFYSCSGSTNEECTVDIVRTNINDLLAQAAAERAAAAAETPVDPAAAESQPIEVAIPEAKTYTGTAIEICAEGRGGPGTTFTAKLKATATLGATLYYTNATTGVSTTGPAEEADITMSCGGRNTDLLVPVEMTAGEELALTFWSEPAGSILITNNAPLVNANCTSSTAGEVAFCASMPSFFGTTVAGAASAERFLLDITTVPPTNPSGVYGDVLVVAVYDASGAAFGGNVKQIYSNVADETKLLHAPFFEFNAITESSGTLTFRYGYPSPEVFIDSLPRTTSGTGTISTLVDSPVTYSSAPLQ